MSHISTPGWCGSDFCHDDPETTTTTTTTTTPTTTMQSPNGGDDNSTAGHVTSVADSADQTDEDQTTSQLIEVNDTLVPGNVSPTMEPVTSAGR